MAVYQAKLFQLNHRHREQAPSHILILIVSVTGFVLTTNAGSTQPHLAAIWG